MNLVIDVSNLFHRSYSILDYSIKGFDISNVENQHQLIRKFVIDTCSIINRFNDVDIVVFCFDDKSFRSELYSEYKNHRSTKKEEFHMTMDNLTELLRFKNLNVVKIENLEADDLIALFVEKFLHEENVIISSDKDLYQLVSQRTCVYIPHNKSRKVIKNKFFDWELKLSEEIEVEFIDPFFIFMEKMLRGCSSDNIPSLVKKGFRTKKIDNIINDLFRILKSSDESLELSLKKSFDNNELDISLEQINNQLKMVYLSEDYFPEDSVKKFDDIEFKSNRAQELTYNSILENTVYFK